VYIKPTYKSRTKGGCYVLLKGLLGKYLIYKGLCARAIESSIDTLVLRFPSQEKGVYPWNYTIWNGGPSIGGCKRNTIK